MQREYRSGTLRDKLFGSGPSISERHPAYGYRGMFAGD
jgi:hypothetical protein